MNFRKTKIEWCSHTWNPVSGCKHGCAYCYARRIVDRFGPHATERPMADPDTGATGILNEPNAPGCYTICRAGKLADEAGNYIRSTPYPMGFAPTFSAHLLDLPAKHSTPARVFVCNMGDLFGSWVPDAWIEAVFDACRAAPIHTYMFLTKNPKRYCELANAGKLPREDNFWYGTTITRKDDPFFGEAISYNTFLSIEPIMEHLDAGLGSFGGVRWVIVGAMTGPGSSRHQPQREWVENVVEAARITQAAVFMKDSLADIWGGELLREYPKGMNTEEVQEKRVPRCDGCEHCRELQQGARGKTRTCAIGDEGQPKHIPAHYARFSPLWCPRREEN